MRWGDFRRSDNVEDRTAEGSGGGFPVGGGMQLGGGALIVIVIASLIFGVNPLEMIGMMEGGAPVPSSPPPAQAPPGYGPQHAPSPGQPPSEAKGSRLDPTTKNFVSAVLGDTEDVWGAIFQQLGTRYQPPRLVLFDGRTRSACGTASAASGPFYCPGDRELYLDTSFFNELSRKFGAPGDFAQAYVIAHEVGHHVQNLTGTMDKVDQQMQRDPRNRNALSIRLELQADCYAGVWGYYAQKRNALEAGDLEEGLRAASAVGDDQIQRRTQGVVRPESFTHGSAEQRQRWFRTGFESGDIRKCNTFSQ